MIQFIVRVLLNAALFSFVYPLVAHGVQFHGTFPEAIVFSLAFVVVANIIGLFIGLVTVAVSFVTAGIGLYILIPMLIFGFWLIPALQLQVFAHMFPHAFTVANWGSAIWAGFFLMLVNYMTATKSKKPIASK